MEINVDGKSYILTTDLASKISEACTNFISGKWNCHVKDCSTCIFTNKYPRIPCYLEFKLRNWTNPKLYFIGFCKKLLKAINKWGNKKNYITIKENTFYIYNYKLEDFRNTCKKLIKTKGNCYNIDCSLCLFNIETLGIKCVAEEDKDLIKYCKQFLEQTYKCDCLICKNLESCKIANLLKVKETKTNFTNCQKFVKSEV